MEWIATHRDRLVSLFGAYYPPDTVRAILRLIRPALRLTSAGTRPGPARPGSARPRFSPPGSARRSLRSGFSRAGGPPLLPPDTARPTWAGRPLDFLAVIDFAEMAGVLSLPELPATGAAYFYYAAEIPRPWGDDPAERDGWRVLSGTPAEAVPMAGGTSAAHAVPLAAEPLLSLPGPYEPSVRALDATWSGFLDVYEQLYEAWLRFAWAELPRHQLAGWPILVQRSLGEDQRLLLQLDSDERLGRCWGDPGTVYFHARAGDLSRGALDRCRLTLQAR
ncbi:YwqG family protein [Actinomadura scrupuli]|uniref:YwqG family protein n=1 Tax=Actinomadura scrupuli TaxID=559629 RepID=UPI003D95B6A8